MEVESVCGRQNLSVSDLHPSANRVDAVTSTTNINLTVTQFSQYILKNPECKCLVGVRGKWYDVTSFRDKHPGGPLLLDKCHGKDATGLVESFHERDVLKGWRPVAINEQSKKTLDGAAASFKQLHGEFLAQGYFKTSMWWYAKKIAVTFLFFLCCTVIAARTQSNSPWPAAISGLFLGLFWQQCGFLMHDLMHNEVTHRRAIDRWIGMFFGSFCLGMSAHWWRDEHFEHHAFTNVVDKKSMYVDPQMQEEVWAQSPLLFPLYFDRGGPFRDWVQTQLISWQHVLWIPLCVVGGRFAIVINGVFKEKRWYEIITLSLHNICLMILMNRWFPFWPQRLLFYTVAAVFEGILHVQLLLSHYAKPWTEMDKLMTSVHWYEMQVYSNLNIKNPIWLDWFHGGLNFHIEHHLYPAMPRHRFREASRRIKEVCNELGIEYDECGWFEAIKRTVCNLKEMAYLYKSTLQQRKKHLI